MGTAAFFDLDNTVVRGSSLYPFAGALLRSGRVSPAEVVRFAWLNLRFVATRSESASGRDLVVDRALSLVAGQRVENVMDLCRSVVPALVRDRLNMAVVQEIRRHQRAGSQTWLVTASPRELATSIARELGMTGALGTQAAIAGGVYTGELVGGVLHGARKADAVAALMAVEGLSPGDCSAYSDSINDLPLLALVGSATVVNANSRLRQVARKNGWAIMDAQRLPASPKVERSLSD